MGDGTFNGITLLLCTDSYSIREVVLLINVLIIKYDIHCNIRYFKPHLPRVMLLKNTSLNYVQLLNPLCINI